MWEPGSQGRDTCIWDIFGLSWELDGTTGDVIQEISECILF